MRLLHVISSMDPKKGGPSQGLRNLNPFLEGHGMHVEIVCLDDEDLQAVQPNKLLKHKIGKGFSAFQYNSKLRSWLIKNLTSFDFVSVHGIWQYPNYAVYSAITHLKRKGEKHIPKVVIMPHGMLDPYFQTAKDRKWKALRNEIVWRLTERKAINAADAIFFTCQVELELARKTFKGYHPKKEINVGYGIQEPPVFDVRMQSEFEQCCPELNNNAYWLFLSRIDPKKGIDILIAAYKNLKQRGLSLPHLVIAGPIDSAYALKMVEAAKEIDTIHFPGMLTGDQKWGAFYGCTAFLLPSHQENFGIAIVEAMACGKPVLISNKVNIWKEIQAGNGGWVLEEINMLNLVDELNSILNLDKVQLSNKGNYARMTFEKYFRVEDKAAQFVSALLSCDK
jgi:glycosyltransferase involved in cell wall biosynthesis